MVAGIFLAAGEGRRFGSGKLLSPVDGVPVIVRSLKASVESSLGEIIVVLGHEADLIEKKIREYFAGTGKLRIVINSNFKEGMISSLNCGLKELKEGTDGAMMILGDMPFVRSDTINKLIRSWNGRDFLIPEVNGKKVHPRIIPEAVFKDFQELDSLGSGKAVLEKNRNIIKTVAFRSEKEFRDIDLRSDLPDSGEN
ncbi:MAG: nucleotidyltransferase family protein [Acidobacteriota bacterium]